MRDNSGNGKAENNMRDPTTRDLEGKEGPAQQSGRMVEGGSAFDIAGNAKVRGEKPSPGNRERGEGASTDPALAIDNDDS